MSADRQSVAPGSSQTAGNATTPELAGRITVKDAVLTKIAEHATASLLHVPRKSVSADISAARDGIAVTLRTPMAVPSLNDSAAVAAAQPLMDRIQHLQKELQSTLTHMLGRKVIRVNMHVTGAVITPTRRVQ